MNWRGGGHDGNFSIPNHLIFSFQDTVTATIALILTFCKDSGKDFQGYQIV